MTGTLSSETNNSGYENMKSLATQIYNDYSHNKRQLTQRKYTNNQFIYIKILYIYKRYIIRGALYVRM